MCCLSLWSRASQKCRWLLSLNPILAVSLAAVTVAFAAAVLAGCFVYFACHLGVEKTSYLWNFSTAPSELNSIPSILIFLQWPLRKLVHIKTGLEWPHELALIFVVVVVIAVSRKGKVLPCQNLRIAAALPGFSPHPANESTRRQVCMFAAHLTQAEEGMNVIFFSRMVSCHAKLACSVEFAWPRLGDNLRGVPTKIPWWFSKADLVTRFPPHPCSDFREIYSDPQGACAI